MVFGALTGEDKDKTYVNETQNSKVLQTHSACNNDNTNIYR